MPKSDDPIRNREFLVGSGGGFTTYTLYHHCKNFEHLLDTNPGNEDLRQAIVVMVNSAMERYVRVVSNDLVSIMRLQISLKDFEGSWIKKSQRFFNKLCGFGTPSIHEWDVLEDIYMVRNIIAHNYGSIGELNNRDDKRKILRIVDKRSDLEVENEWLVVSEGYSRFTISEARKLSETVMNEVSNITGRYNEFHQNSP